RRAHPARVRVQPGRPPAPAVCSCSMTDPLAALLATLAQHYTIEREAGVGGMATVYLARDLKHDRHVALKVLKPELAALLGVERFLSEIRVTAHLQHQIGRASCRERV